MSVVGPTMKLLDLYCGSGGAAMGYYRAGFTEIVGVDIEPQPNYPFTFVQADALEYLAAHWQEYDAFHASPVCKGYTIMHNLPWLRDKVYPLQILPTREMFKAIHAESGKPWMIENVMGARWGAKGLKKRGLEAHGMQAGWLCGLMFNLPMYRHRLFESSFFWMAPAHPKHQYRIRLGNQLAGRARDFVFPTPNPRSERAVYGGTKRGLPGQMAGLNLTHFSGAKDKRGGPLPKSKDGQFGAAWRSTAAAMGVDWMDRNGLTQAIPPVYTEYIGAALLKEMKP